MQVRIIKYSNDNGSREGVFFTEDFETAADEFVPHGLTVDSDKVCECDLDVSFPLEYNLERQ